MPTVVDRPKMLFRDAPQLAQYRKLLVRTPRTDTEAAAFHQGAMHLASCGSLVGDELEPLLAQDDIEALAIVKRQGSGVALPPIDRRNQPPCDGEHVGIEVDANDRPGRCEASLREPGNDPGSASDI